MLENPFYFTEEAKQQRCYWRRVVAVALVALMIGLAAGLLLYPQKANAQNLVARSNGDTVKLYVKPCTNKEILERIKPEYHGRFRQGDSEISGKTYGMCWTPLENGNVLMVYEDGEYGQWPMTEFQKEEGV